MCIFPTGASAVPSNQVLPVAQLGHLYKSEISSATCDLAPVSSNILESVAAQESSSARKGPKSFQAFSREVPPDIVQLIMEKAVRLAPEEMPRQLAEFREVNKLFSEIADAIERQANDIAYASTATKTLNILRCDQKERRRPTLQALYNIWPHIEVPLSKIGIPANREMLLETLADRSGKASLSLQLQDIRPEEFGDIRRIVENNRGTAIELNLYGSALSAADMTELLSMFAENQSMVKLQFGGSELNFEALSPVIARFSKLKTLVFTSIRGDREAMAPLALALDRFSSLVKLALAFCPIGPRTMSSLASALVNHRSLVELELQYSSIDGETMHELAVAGERFPPIRYLDLWENPLGNEGMRELCPVLRGLRHSLEHLDLAGTEIGPDGARELAAVLPELVHLKTLNFESNPVGNGGMQALIPVLAAHPSIQELKIHDCGFGYAQATALAEALATKNCSLRYMRFDWIGPSATQASTVFSTLSRMESLQTLVMPHRVHHFRIETISLPLNDQQDSGGNGS